MMENESSYLLSNEKKVAETRTHKIDFDSGHFGNIKRPVGTDELVGEINGWWKKICAENIVDPEDNQLARFDYYLLELGKNALEHGEGGEIKVRFESSRIIATVLDYGQGFEDLDEIEYYSSSQMGHGLWEVRNYSDEFIVETNGKKFIKIKNEKGLVEAGGSNILSGSRITFVKNLVKGAIRNTND